MLVHNQIFKDKELSEKERYNREWIIKCPHCGTTDIDSLDKTIIQISGCTNCLGDLKTKGKWNNIGHRLMLNIMQRFSIPEVKMTIIKYKFEKILGV